MNRPKLRRKLSWDNEGALEGLPLYLIILVVIAAVAIVIIFSYLTVLRTVELEEIEVYIDEQKADPLETTEGTHGVYVVAIGDDGSKLKDVTITLTGAGVNMAKKTDSNGEAHFGSLDFTIVSGTYDSVQIEATYDGGNVNTPISESLLVSPN
jgi:hypothetical protein